MPKFQLNNDDMNFDRYESRFRSNIYNTLKGRIRLSILERDFLQKLPSLSNMTVLDAAAGSGEFSIVMAQKGARILINDISKKMLQAAKENLASEGLESFVEYAHCRLQDLEGSKRFDLITFHGAIGWMVDQREALQKLVSLLKPGGYVSLLFFNADRLIYKHGVLGNLSMISKGELLPEVKKKRKSLTPTRPLQYTTVAQWLTDMQCRILHKSGVRIFYQLSRDVSMFTGKEDLLLQHELDFSTIEPFLWLGQHIHIIAQKEKL